MKKGIAIAISMIILCVVIISFSRGRGVSAKNYYAWHNSKESSLSKWKTSGDFLFNAMYRPVEFMALSELNGEEYSNSKYSEALKNYTCCEHLLLKIFAKDTISEALSYNIGQNEMYYERIRYLNSEFGSKTYLLDGKDTLPCTFFLFERTFKMRPYISMNLIYEKKDKERYNPMTLVIEPNIFNTEILRIDFKEDDFSQIPRLKN